MSATPAFISPDLLKWARTRTGASIEAVAKKINTKPDRLRAWEDGKEHPTMRQAQHLSNALHIPFGYLFLDAPPQEIVPIADFRTVNPKGVGEASPELLDLLSDVVLKQQWYREFLEQEGRSKLSFVGSFTAKASPATIASDIAATLGINADLRRDCDSWEELLSRIIKNAEALGIVVMRSGVVGSNSRRTLYASEFRGFAISDDLAPLIFINSTDARAAQIFTLAHELSHIWIGATGISNEPLLDATPGGNAIETLCNQVAAEVLVPSAEFVGRWSSSESIEANIRALRLQFRVSALVVLRRAFDLGKLPKTTYYEYYNKEYQHYKENEDSGDGGGNFYNTFFSRNSFPFAHAVISCVAEGRTMYREAARLLNINVPTIHKISEQIYEKSVRK